MRKHIFATRVFSPHWNQDKDVAEVNDEDPSGSLLIPYPFSYFEFMVNEHYWLVECAEQEDKSAVLKYYFYYENQWLQVTCREFDDCSVFKLLKEQVIGALIALEAKAASRTNHEDARKPPTPTMLKRLKKIFNQEFNFGYSVIDLTKKKSVRTDSSEPPQYRVRLHFRRGFWRTRLGKQERVRWCLVGDPALGFVDKHYRF